MQDPDKTDDACIDHLNETQLEHPDWWRRTRSNDVMRRKNVTILRTFDFGIMAGRQHMKQQNVRACP